MTENFSDRKTFMSKFNEGQLQIIRLNNSWNKANYYSEKGMIYEWNNTLNTIWRELYADASNKSDKYAKYITRINNLIIQNNGKRGYKFFLLEKKHEFLKKLQDDVGKGTKKESQYEDIL